MTGNLTVAIDPVRRVVELHQQGPLELAPRVIEVPFAAWKATTAEVLVVEVKAEQQYAKNQGRKVLPIAPV